ncbi:DamX-like protein [Glaciecola sp. MH2013]|uniref:SPOR domain-containing protein n=1 Tax=Glaciecola sp. MH2013 TaxID=2785524 RepID=UPI00189EDBA0|nr:DamX-like protein [Glaciecola sp. MH2013]MBF7073770.1 DamX-like protein [Glaciecola sp. MH2013]
MSELQERLKHLINYSSQLIFVSGDTIAQQQRSLEEFLSIQQENTEISYFTAELSMESADFRRIICRQLMGIKLGSFNKPLKELLKKLHEQQGPFLLCIKQAQMLPNGFLQELWDWVCDSKKLSAEHHVNVILFGETAWAEKAKKWLPKKNRNRPILLSSQSVSAETSFDLQALEILLSDDRASRFSYAKFDDAPLVSQKWFIITILFLLLVVFVGLMTWQYPQQVKHFVKTGELEMKESLVQDELAEKNLALDQQNQLLEPSAAPTAPIESTDSELISPIASDELEDTSKQSTAPIELVSTWEDAKKASEDKVEELRSDFAVPDILSVEQLDEQLGDGLLAQEDTIDNSSSADMSESPQQDNNFSFDETRILGLSEPAILLQLSGIKDLSVLNEFIVDNNLSDSVWVYETTRYGGSWHVVLLNQSFVSIEEAREEVSRLPATIQNMQPFAKDLRQVKQEIGNRQ